MFMFFKPAGERRDCPLHLSSCSLSLFYVTLALPSHILRHNLSPPTHSHPSFSCALFLTLKCVNVMGAGRSWLGGSDTHTHTSVSESTVTSGQFDALRIRRASKTALAHWLWLWSISPVCLLQRCLCVCVCVKPIVPMWRDDRLQPSGFGLLTHPSVEMFQPFTNTETHTHTHRAQLHFPWLLPAANQMLMCLFDFLVSTDSLKVTVQPVLALLLNIQIHTACTLPEML